MTSAQNTISGDLFEHIENTIDNLPPSGGDEFQDLSVDEEMKWKELLVHIINGDYSQAAEAAINMDYQLIQFLHQDNGEETAFYLLEKDSLGENYYGTYIFNPSACRQLVIQCPHPKADVNTGLEGIFAFKDLSATAYFLSGTHRCNSSEESPCSGTTSVCSSTSQAYRKSDPAHNVRAAFHLATEVLVDALPEVTFVQLHGFSKRDTDPYVIMSNGGRDEPMTDYAALIQDGLLMADGMLSFEIGHLNTSWTRLLGFTNTQGRYINGSVDPCTNNATQSNGRFIHIEQERSRLRADESGWVKMKLALEMAFPCQPTHSPDLLANTTFYTLTQRGSLSLDAAFPAASAEIRVFNMLGQMVFSNLIQPAETIQLPRLSSLGLLAISVKGRLTESQLYWIP